MIPWLEVALVAEDHRPLAAELSSWLRQWGAREIHVFNSNTEACAAVAELAPHLDLVLCDVYLSDGRCDRLLGAARRAASRARIVMMTGEAPAQERSDLMLGATPHDMIAKPFTSEFLLERLSTLDDRVARQVSGSLYNMALAQGLTEAMTSARARLVDKAVEDAGGNVSEAARRVGMNRSFMHRLISPRSGSEGGDEG